MSIMRHGLFYVAKAHITYGKRGKLKGGEEHSIAQKAAHIFQTGRGIGINNSRPD